MIKATDLNFKSNDLEVQWNDQHILSFKTLLMSENITGEKIVEKLMEYSTWAFDTLVYIRMFLCMRHHSQEC